MKRIFLYIAGGILISLLLAGTYFLGFQKGRNQEEILPDDSIAAAVVERTTTDYYASSECFVKGLINNMPYQPINWDDLSSGIQSVTYYYNKNLYVWAGEDHGGFVLKLLRTDNPGFCVFLNISDICEIIPIDGSCEFCFGKTDIDGDGSDELVFAGRTIQEEGNRICLTFYKMNTDTEPPYFVIINPIAYSGNMGQARIEAAEKNNELGFGYVYLYDEYDGKRHHETAWRLPRNSWNWEPFSLN